MATSSSDGGRFMVAIVMLVDVLLVSILAIIPSGYENTKIAKRYIKMPECPFYLIEFKVYIKIYTIIYVI